MPQPHVAQSKAKRDQEYKRQHEHGDVTTHAANEPEGPEATVAFGGPATVIGFKRMRPAGSC